METPPTTSCQVLIVEDAPDIQEVLRLILQSQGFTVRQAWDGVEAWQILETWIPDVILTDVMMPRMDGIELLRRIRQQARLIHIPVVVLTASYRGAERAEEAGAALVLRKPIELPELATMLRTLIDGKASYSASASSVD